MPKNKPWLPPCLVVFTLMAVLSSCRVYTTRTGPEAFDLTTQEKAQLEESVASLGDGEAAYRLSKYYSYTLDDREGWRFWPSKSAQLGYTIAIEDIAGEEEEKRVLKAIRAKRAKAQQPSS